jgi:hypothetical protein
MSSDPNMEDVDCVSSLIFFTDGPSVLVAAVVEPCAIYSASVIQ